MAGVPEPLLDELLGELLAARFNRATVRKISGGSLVAPSAVANFFAVGWEWSNSVIRTASGIPDRLNSSRSPRGVTDPRTPLGEGLLGLP